MRHIFTILLALSLAGCMTFGDIRAEDPIESLRSEKSPQDLANCIAYQGKAEQPDAEFGIYQMGDVWHVTMGMTSTFIWSTPMAFAEVSIRPRPEGGSTAELRAKPAWHGRHNFWRLVIRCAGAG